MEVIFACIFCEQLLGLLFTCTVPIRKFGFVNFPQTDFCMPCKLIKHTFQNVNTSVCSERGTVKNNVIVFKVIPFAGCIGIIIVGSFSIKFSADPVGLVFRNTVIRNDAFFLFVFIAAPDKYRDRVVMIF